MKNLAVSKCKRELIEIYKHALEAIKPERIVKSSIGLEQNQLIIKERVQGNKHEQQQHPFIRFDLNRTRLHVIGGGKCSMAMAQGVADVANQARATSLFSHGCLSVPIVSKSAFESDLHAQNQLNSIQVKCRFGAANNLPDESSIQATQFMLEQVAEACQQDRQLGLSSLFIVLVSGGGSACLTSPRHISLAQKTTLIKELVQKGASIVELNTVRRCFSNIKGGNLARQILRLNPEAQVVSLIISDVINDPIEFIASGPTFLGPEFGFEELTKVMSKYGLDIPEEFEKCKGTLESEMDSTPGNNSVINKVIGNNKLALDSVINKAKELDYCVKLVGDNLSGNTSEIVQNLTGTYALSEPNNHKILIVCGGEATVERKPHESWGLGGRTQEMALDYMLHKLEHQKPVDEYIDIFLASSTDGQDGPTDVAACLASHFEWSLKPAFDLEKLRTAKRTHDSYNFWTQHKPEWIVKTGPTGTNVMDLYFLLIMKLHK